MKPDAPHSFVPRNPTETPSMPPPSRPHSFRPRDPETAEGRTTCKCGRDANHDVHLASMLAKQVGKCIDCLERPSARKGQCWKCYKATLPGSSEVTLSTTLSTEMAVEVALAASRLGVSRSAWIRVQLIKALGEAAESGAPRT